MRMCYAWCSTGAASSRGVETYADGGLEGDPARAVGAPAQVARQAILNGAGPKDGLVAVKVWTSSACCHMAEPRICGAFLQVACKLPCLTPAGTEALK